jgi:hypothetical protein
VSGGQGLLGRLCVVPPGLCHCRFRLDRPIEGLTRHIFSAKAEFTAGQSSFTAVPGRQHNCFQQSALRAPAPSQLRFTGFGTARQKMALNDGQIPNPNVVRVAPGSRYHRVEGNRRASRNGPVSDPPPEIPNVTIRAFHRCREAARCSQRVAPLLSPGVVLRLQRVPSECLHPPRGG